MFNITNEKEVQSVGMVSPNTLVHGDCLEVRHSGELCYTF